MVRVPAGPFTMGHDRIRDGVHPARRVWLGSFRIDRTEVTVSQFQRCVKAGACKHAHFRDAARRYCNMGRPKRGDHPMNCVTWDGARAYCRWVGKRLPTEAEWEKAARGSGQRVYPWGNTREKRSASCHRAWHWYCYPRHTAPVGVRRAGRSPYGVLDMAGNVSEWVRDCRIYGFFKKAPERNPLASKKGCRYRRVRGGRWNRSPSSALYRSYSNARNTDYGNGFRCARSSGG